MAEKEDILHIPQRHLSELEMQYINLSIERSKLTREQSQIILNKGLMLFFALILLAVILQQVYDNINQLLTNMLILIGLAVMGVSIIPYMRAVKDEEKRINMLLETLIGGRKD